MLNNDDDERKWIVMISKGVIIAELTGDHDIIANDKYSY